MKSIEITMAERGVLHHISELVKYVNRTHLANRDNEFGLEFLSLRKKLQHLMIDIEAIYDRAEIFRLNIKEPDPIPLLNEQISMNAEFIPRQPLPPMTYVEFDDA